MSATIKKILKVFLTLLVLLSAAKLLIAGYDIDEQYAVAMAYRIVQGDRLLLDMWEPHQTSAFLSVLLLIPYLALTKTTTGIFLYLRFAGLFICFLVTLLLYRAIRHFLEKDYAQLICCVFALFLPKLIFLTEYSNMQTWFLMLVLLCLMPYPAKPDNTNSDTSTDIVYADRPHPYLRTAAAGIFLSLEVLSYPSAVLVFPALLIWLFKYEKKTTAGKQALLLTGVCFACAAVFLGYLFSYMSLNDILTSLSAVMNDGSHTITISEKLSTNLSSLGEILKLFAVYAIFATALYVLLFVVSSRFTAAQTTAPASERTSRLKPCMTHFQAFEAENGRFLTWATLLLLCTMTGQILIWVFGSKYPNYPMVEYFFLPAIYFALLILHKKRVSAHAFLLVVVPLVSFFGILLFTNLYLLGIAPFLGVAVVGVFICLGMEGKQRQFYPILLVWVLVLLFGRCYIIRISGGAHFTVFDEISLIRQGSSIGIIADTESVRRYNESTALLQAYIPEDSNVFYVGCTTDVYFMQDVNICTPSTISTPTYDETVATYFETHSDKTPDYVICDRDYADLTADTWIALYLSEICVSTPVAENNYLVIYEVVQ